MPILYIQNTAATNSLSATPIPAPPSANSPKTVIDWAMATLSGITGNCNWTLCVTATGTGTGLPVTNNTRLILGTINAPIATSGGSFRNEFPGGLVACTIASSVVVQAIPGAGATGGAVDVYIGYHYE